MNERQTYRVMRREAQDIVLTAQPFVALRLTAAGWLCFGTGNQVECEAMVMRSVAGQVVRWSDIPHGAQCTVKA